MLNFKWVIFNCGGSTVQNCFVPTTNQNI